MVLSLARHTQDLDSTCDIFFAIYADFVVLGSALFAFPALDMSASMRKF